MRPQAGFPSDSQPIWAASAGVNLVSPTPQCAHRKAVGVASPSLCDADGVRLAQVIRAAADEALCRAFLPLGPVAHHGDAPHVVDLCQLVVYRRLRARRIVVFLLVHSGVGFVAFDRQFKDLLVFLYCAVCLLEFETGLD